MTILKIKGILLIALTILIGGCSVSKRMQKELEQQSQESNFFTGVVVYNTKSDKKIIDYQGSKYFTPASNVKLFTFYTAWKTLKDSVASFEYAELKDSLIIRGTGDPGFLNDSINKCSLEVLRNTNKNIYLINDEIEDTPYGDGWSWDDFPYYYMPERSVFPVFGNTLDLSKNEENLIVTPSLFAENVKVVDSFQNSREPEENIFYVRNSDSFEKKEIPFKMSNQLVADLLGQELGTKVTLIPSKDSYVFKPVNRVVYDSLFTKMLVDSDNFIAEQLMLQVGKKVEGTFRVRAGIEYALDHFFKEIPQIPRWVDGSGLSRYNLFTPSSMVYVLKKLYEEIPHQQLFNYFPKGGESGTLKNGYESQPYIRAKSGTLSNNYCLSGYLITKKGTVLIFSFMNNHYYDKSEARKKEMAAYFSKLYEAY
jgi:D-alanyl-D-alanine carboxypeptidase/D-alanyl-D-alanine-endopeptidase (penicillin-binding protein 4)